ncbi:MAG: uridine kinase [Geodermatophilaceae bacterium]
MDPAALPDRLSAALVDLDVPGQALRVAIDGPRAADPGGFADALVAPLRVRGRPAVRIRAETFYRDAALRLEYGRTDLESFASGWLDDGALRREVLEPTGPGGNGRYLPSLRDPISNRATRDPARQAEPGLILLLSGELLLGRDLPFDWAIHLALSASARRRRTSKEWQWTLPALDDYDAAVDPVRTADVVLRYDDPGHPAVRVKGVDH